jgi:hypothetical protein
VRLPGGRSLTVNGRQKEKESFMATAKRQAQISLGKKGENRTVRVSHPGKLTPGEIRAIDDVLINKVIKDLTGCACLSGTIDVIWERNFDKVLDVELG